MRDVFIIGSKGIPCAYGGYETFVDKLTEYHKDDPDIRYHVACKNSAEKEFRYNNARCFSVEVPNLGSAQAILYDIRAIKQSIEYIKKNNIQNPLIYILACRIGPFVKGFQKQIHALGGELYINPDGHEWLRSKWSAPVRKYWKTSEQMTVKHSDLVICDSKNIEKYIRGTYSSYNLSTTYVAYGSETRKSVLADEDEKYTGWLKEKGIKSKGYYLVVGRFVPENNYETMIREFLKSGTDKDFVLITPVNEKFLNELEEKTHFKNDSRIKFVGTVYDKELLMKIRENAYGYFHGHEVGGTNPSLLEALGSTELNLLLGVGFNREVAEDAALYWDKTPGDLASLIDSADAMSSEAISEYGIKAKKRIADFYSWPYIAEEYKKIFLGGQK